ncbi:MAG: DUF2007 domain-containing protein [Pirellulaceae bacterium]
MSGEPTVIYHAANLQQAHILKGVLEERGIASWIVNDNIQVAGGGLPLGWTAAAMVSVGQSDAIEARQIAEEFDQTTAHDPTSDPPAIEPPPPATWKEWPACPRCQTPRQARCPICGTAGTEFPLADLEETPEGPRVLLICATCDDHFRPEFFRLCHQCGYDYGDGIAVTGPHSPSDYGTRGWIVLAGLLLGTLALAAYFVMLWR